MTTHYIWDVENDSYLMETDGDGNTTAVYTNEPVQYGRLISQRRGNTTSYYHFDGQGSTRQLTDQNANVTDEYTYSAFGETVATSGTTTNPFGCKGALGYYANPETNDTYVRKRTLQPRTARWLSPDPLGFPQGTNRYQYALNNPMLFSDPSGMICGCCCCVESLEFDPSSVTNRHPLIPGTSIGYYFELLAKISTKLSARAGFKKCELEWWEWTNDRPPLQVSKFPDNKWCETGEVEDAHKKGRYFCGQIGKGTIADWCLFFHPDCSRDSSHCYPKTCGWHHTFTLPDAPQSGRAPGLNSKLYFHVVIKSAEDCDCPQDELVWEGCQFMEIDRNGKIIYDGRILEKHLCPDFPPFNPNECPQKSQ